MRIDESGLSKTTPKPWRRRAEWSGGAGGEVRICSLKVSVTEEVRA